MKKYLATILVGLILTSFVYLEPKQVEAQTAWTPPIGIPAPSFGINEVAPAYNQSNTSHYWVRSTSCNDANNGGRGSSAAPRCTIPASLGVGAMVTIEGTYTTDHINIPINANGTASQPVFIKGISNAQRATLTRGLTVQGGYFILEYFNGVWTNASPGKIQMWTHHGVLRHTHLRGDPNGGMGGVGGVVLNGYNHVVWDNVIQYAGDYRLGQAGHPCGSGVPNFGTCDQDVHGINVSPHDEDGDGRGTTDTWLLDNDISYASGDGVQIGGGTNGSHGCTQWSGTQCTFVDTNKITIRNIYVGRNKSHHNKQTGLWVKQAKDIIFSQNEVYGHRYSDSSPGGGGMGFQYGPERVWFLYNHIHDNETGIGSGSDSNPPNNLDKRIFMIGNVIHDIHARSGWFDAAGWNHSGIAMAGAPHRYVINNTIYDVDRGISFVGGSMDIQNNIISNVTHAQGVHIQLGDAVVSATSSSYHNNIFYQNGQAIKIKYGSTSYSDLAAFQAAFPGRADTSIKANPLFVNAAGGDFHLQSGSPAIDITDSTDTSLAVGYQQAYGAPLTVDFGGSPRLQGAAYDAGAYEFASGGTPTPTPTPTPIKGDINLDHIVNSIDYSIMNSDWFTSNARSDLNSDGLVNAIDYSLLNANWFRTW